MKVSTHANYDIKNGTTYVYYSFSNSSYPLNKPVTFGSRFNYTQKSICRVVDEENLKKNFHGKILGSKEFNFNIIY